VVCWLSFAINSKYANGSLGVISSLISTLWQLHDFQFIALFIQQTTRNDFFDNIDQATGRPTIVNWENILNRIVDDYEGFVTIPHGVQKDATQNGWDARVKKKKGKHWGMRFSLQDNGLGTNIVVFTDWGTTGLTGRVLSGDDLNKDLPIEERWGRFENLAFTKDPTEEALGARGQGKFIFLAASKTKRIVYDTLREDGIYRFGARYFHAPAQTAGRPETGQYWYLKSHALGEQPDFSWRTRRHCQFAAQSPLHLLLPITVEYL
jgi:hypothetical protein